MKGDITKLDANFKQESATLENGEKIYKLPCKDIDLYGGAYYDEQDKCFRRMDGKVAKSINYGIEVLSTCTAGG